MHFVNPNPVRMVENTPRSPPPGPPRLYSTSSTSGHSPFYLRVLHPPPADQPSPRPENPHPSRSAPKSTHNAAPSDPIESPKLRLQPRLDVGTMPSEEFRHHRQAATTTVRQRSTTPDPQRTVVMGSPSITRGLFSDSKPLVKHEYAATPASEKARHLLTSGTHREEQHRPPFDGTHVTSHRHDGLYQHLEDHLRRELGEAEKHHREGLVERQIAEFQEMRLDFMMQRNTLEHRQQMRNRLISSVLESSARKLSDEHRQNQSQSPLPASSSPPVSATAVRSGAATASPRSAMMRSPQVNAELNKPTEHLLQQIIVDEEHCARSMAETSAAHMWVILRQLWHCSSQGLHPTTLHTQERHQFMLIRSAYEEEHAQVFQRQEQWRWEQRAARVQFWAKRLSTMVADEDREREALATDFQRGRAQLQAAFLRQLRILEEECAEEAARKRAMRARSVLALLSVEESTRDALLAQQLEERSRLRREEETAFRSLISHTSRFRAVLLKEQEERMALSDLQRSERSLLELRCANEAQAILLRPIASLVAEAEAVLLRQSSSASPSTEERRRRKRDDGERSDLSPVLPPRDPAHVQLSDDESTLQRVARALHPTNLVEPPHSSHAHAQPPQHAPPSLHDSDQAAGRMNSPSQQKGRSAFTEMGSSTTSSFMQHTASSQGRLGVRSGSSQPEAFRGDSSTGRNSSVSSAVEQLQAPPPPPPPQQVSESSAPLVRIHTISPLRIQRNVERLSKPKERQHSPPEEVATRAQHVDGGDDVLFPLHSFATTTHSTRSSPRSRRSGRESVEPMALHSGKLPTGKTVMILRDSGTKSNAAVKSAARGATGASAVVRGTRRYVDATYSPSTAAGAAMPASLNELPPPTKSRGPHGPSASTTKKGQDQARHERWEQATLRMYEQRFQTTSSSGHVPPPPRWN